MGKRVCAEGGCPVLVPSGTSRCPTHARGTSTQRGYGTEHQAERAKWEAIINKTGWPCARCPHSIQPGQPFDLDHADDRETYLGPSCVTCNRSAAGRKSHGLAPRSIK